MLRSKAVRRSNVSAIGLIQYRYMHIHVPHNVPLCKYINTFYLVLCKVMSLMSFQNFYDAIWSLVSAQSSLCERTGCMCEYTSASAVINDFGAKTGGLRRC
jgi:hypothetical protein